MPLITLVVLMAVAGGLAVALFPGRAGAFLQGLAVKWWQFLVGFVFGVVSITAVGGWSPFLLMVFFMLAGSVWDVYGHVGPARHCQRAAPGRDTTLRAGGAQSAGRAGERDGDHREGWGGLRRDLSLQDPCSPQPLLADDRSSPVHRPCSCGEGRLDSQVVLLVHPPSPLHARRRGGGGDS